tara:strand:- start:902 stop:1810 length:909 start_codon:yes stop_codon:yes gene_type:complete
MGVNLARHVYKYDKIVVGSSLRAMLYAYYNGLPMVFTKISQPTLIDYFEPEICLAGIGMENKMERIVSTNGELSRGIQKLEAWKRLSLLLSLSGLMPLSDKAESIRIEGNSLRIVLGRARMAVFEFNKLILFDDDNLSNIYPKEEKNPIFKVLDWVDVKSGMSHSFDAIHTEDDFVKEIVFYKSLRIMGTKRLKDLVSVSYIAGDNLSNFEHSDTYARFKTLELMKKAGIRGTRNGRDVKNPEKYKYYALKLESDRREIFPDFLHTWEHSGGIEGNYLSESEIISSYSGTDNEYLRMLNDKL